jgi:hypothetical protein
MLAAPGAGSLLRGIGKIITALEAQDRDLASDGG